MKLREHPAISGKNDQFRADPRLLKVQPGFNVRDLDTPAAREAMESLKAQIRGVGVRDPLEVRLIEEDLFIVSGHRRHRAVMELIAEGEEILTVPAIAEPKNMTDAERAAGLYTMNSGEPLTALEIAEVVRRLLAYGWDRHNVAHRLGFKSAQTVSNYEEMIVLPETMRRAVREGEVSATNARAIVRQEGPLLAPERLAEAKKTAAAKGKKKVTAASLPPRAPRAPKVQEAPEPPRNQAKVERALADLHSVVAGEYPASVAASVYKALSADDVLAVIGWLSGFEAALRGDDADQAAVG